MALSEPSDTAPQARTRRCWAYAGQCSNSMGTLLPALPGREAGGLEGPCCCQGCPLDTQREDLLPNSSLRCRTQQTKPVGQLALPWLQKVLGPVHSAVGSTSLLVWLEF